MKNALYALSADPITFGHINLIERASSIFEKLTIGVGINPFKKYLFSPEERINLVRKSLLHILNIEIVYFEGALVDYAYEQGIPVIVRGIRNSEDLNFEMTLHQVGESQNLGIDTFFLPSKPNLVHVSSSTVKALQGINGLIHEYVPLCVKEALEKKISSQIILGITGEIGAGKTFLSNEFQRLGKAFNLPIHCIDVDKIGHEILEKLTEPIYEEFRKDLIKEFGSSLDKGNHFIDRRMLGKFLFEDSKHLEQFNQKIYKPLLTRLRKELAGKRGLVLLDSALLIESKMTYLCNNNIVLISVDKEIQKTRLSERGYSEEQIQKRISGQYSYTQKKSTLTSIIQKENYGTFWEIENSKVGVDDSIQNTFEKIVAYFNLRQ